MRRVDICSGGLICIALLMMMVMLATPAILAEEGGQRTSNVTLTSAEGGSIFPQVVCLLPKGKLHDL